ncbi:MAG: SDR family NAD(P)-dependent oxidoreductase, partial [Pseudomonadota bacterium]
MPKLTKLSRSVEGKVALITGAASGMGRATARLFADEGAHVAVTDINADGVSAVVDQIKAAGFSAEGWTLDLAESAAINRVVTAVAERFGGLDILVNNAGLSGFAPIDDAGYED